MYSKGYGRFMKITKSNYDTTTSGQEVTLYHLENNSGAYVEVIDFGCRITKIVVPDKTGTLTDICLGYDNLAGYVADGGSLGAVVGRVANRIKDGRFSLNGIDYQLAVNCGPNHLHGGVTGFGSRVWESKIKDDKLILTYHSADGEEGYPGNLTLSVTYGWTEDNELSILYVADTDQDTLFNVTNHTYFNLNGEGNGDVYAHDLFVESDEITELDDTQAPTGRFLSVTNTPFDFRKLHPIGKFFDSDYEQFQKFGTYDHNFVITGTGLREAAILQSKETGIRLTCFTDQPGMQLYIPGDEADMTGKDGKKYQKGCAVCLETQHYPDAINHDNFPDIVLHPDKTFRSKTVYHFSNFS